MGTRRFVVHNPRAPGFEIGVVGGRKEADDVCVCVCACRELRSWTMRSAVGLMGRV